MDNRMQFPPTLIDFNTVGTTGQDHDNYPAPGQARYDWMRMTIIALLAQQSSSQTPTEYRDGTPWYNTGVTPPRLEICVGGKFVPYSDAISLGANAVTAATTLTDWYAQACVLLASLAPDMSFSGSATGPAPTISVPGSLYATLNTNSRAFVYVNGLLIDPRATAIQNGIIQIPPGQMKAGDRYSVILRAIPPQNFYTQDVPAP